MNRRLRSRGPRLAALALAWALALGGLLATRAGAAAPDGYALMPAAVRHAAAQVQPYLVTIETAGGISLGQRSRQQRQSIGGLANPGEGPTTGLILSPDGLIVTSTFNFIRKPRIITVMLPDGSQHVAELLGRDETRKLCLLKIEGVKDLPAAPFAPPDRVRVGQWAISVGVGYGAAEPAVSLGIVSALNRAGGRALQTDANISPANYGGPLVDIDGRILGICVPLNPRARGAGAGSEWYDSGIGFAVPLHGLEHIVQRMAAGETLKPGLLGVFPSPETVDRGVALHQVAPGSPAEQAGMQAGDRVTAVDGQAVDSPMAMRLALARFLAGDKVAVDWRRGDEAFSAEITLATGPFKGDGDAAEDDGAQPPSDPDEPPPAEAAPDDPGAAPDDAPSPDAAP